MESDSAKTSTTELSESESDFHPHLIVDETDEIPSSSSSLPFEECPDTITRHQSLPVIIEDTFEEEETLKKMPKLSISSQNMDLWNNDMTLEAPPNINNYRLTIQNIRPSMPELIHGLASRKHLSTLDIQNNGRLPSSDSRRADLEGGYESYELKPKKLPKLQKPLGWFSGVYIPSFTNIVGTLLYLRMGYVAGQAGVSVGIGIVLFSTFVIAITALSLTGICSNGKIKKGGLYYVVSRALGPQLGGCIGFIFSLANIGMAALYIVGIAEFISDLLQEAGYDYVTFNEVWDNRVFSLGLCVILMLIAFAGPNIENSFTYFFFSTYFISYVNWVIGTFMPVTDEQSVRGVTGYSMATLKANLYPDYRAGENVVSVFAVFFPGFTGMLASTMYVEQLADPGADVAKGLFASIGSTAIMYIYAVFAAGATIVRDADGEMLQSLNETTKLWDKPDCLSTFSCKYGLMNYHQVAELESAWRPLIIVGMLGMTISSTMTNLDQGPIIFQAACKDALFPYLKKFFAKEYGPNKEPRRAYVFFAILTMALCLIGDLNSLNEIVTNLFMVTYALVNYACFDASFARSPGWRPTFPYYNMWISLAAAVICILVMFVISIINSIIICVIFAITMAYFHYCSPEVNWGDTNQAHMYRNALTSLQKLTNTEIHVKNYRPQIMLMSGNPASRVPLLDFAHSITKGDSLLLAAHVIPYPANEHFFQKQTQLQAFLEQWFKHNKIKAFYLNVANQSIRSGSQSFLQTAGLGKLRPNVLMIGFKNWSKLHRENIGEIDEYVGILRDAFESNYGVGILRNGEDGFDHSEELSQLQEKDLSALKRSGEKDGDEFEDAELFGTLMHVRKKSQHHHTPSFRNHHKFYSDRWMFSKPETNPEAKSKKSFHFLKQSFTTHSLTASHSMTGSLHSNNNNRIPSSEPVTPDPTTTTIPDSKVNFTFEPTDKTSDADEERELKLLELQQNLAFELNKFHRTVKRGRIDVWWLYDDGGLTLLIPHLLRLPKSYLEGAQLRIFTLASSQAMIEADEENMIAMLTKFRIEFTNVKVIRDISRKPHRATIRQFEEIIKPWKAGPEENRPGFITEEELSAQKCRTARQLRTQELLQQHSYDSSLIVITLPIPRADISACLYMSWMDVMTRNLPPTLMIRGNNSSVLSFYA